jgi:putative FmdB family regulatory protein
MPLYDYRCPTCGSFRAFRPMRESSFPVACPICAVSSERMLNAPFLSDMNPHDRIAHQRNDKNAHEPQVMSRAELDQSGVPRSQGHYHHEQDAGGTSADQWGRSSRPWMVGH